MRIVFAGTPEFAARSLDAVLEQGHRVLGVLTQPDRPAGRGMRHLPSTVKLRALASGLQVFQPMSLRDPGAQAELARWFGEGKAEVMVVAAYGLILPAAVLALPRFGCVNIHASMLPRWRGAAPIERAILAGDTATAVCIMQMDAGLDTGPVLLARTAGIDARDTAGSLRERLAALGADAIVDVLARFEHGDAFTPQAQAADGVTYAAKIAKSEAVLDFAQSAIELDRRIRAFDPAPGAVGLLRESPIKFWAARPGPHHEPGQPPGTVLSSAGGVMAVACGPQGGDTLLVEEMQKPGGKRLSTMQFLAGFPISSGERFGSLAR